MTRPKKTPQIETQIDDNLRKIFEEDVEQDLPDRLKALVEQLDAKTSRDDGEGGGGSSSDDAGTAGKSASRDGSSSTGSGALAAGRRRPAQTMHTVERAR